MFVAQAQCGYYLASSIRIDLQAAKFFLAAKSTPDYNDDSVTKEIKSKAEKIAPVIKLLPSDSQEKSDKVCQFQGVWSSFTLNYTKCMLDITSGQMEDDYNTYLYMVDGLEFSLYISFL